jgi:hypothetical protein
MIIDLSGRVTVGTGAGGGLGRVQAFARRRDDPRNGFERTLRDCLHSQQLVQSERRVAAEPEAGVAAHLSAAEKTTSRCIWAT